MTDIFGRANLLAKTYSYSSKYSYSSGWGIGAWLFWSFSWLIFYAYSAVTLMFIAKKTATSNGWMAWVPFLNLYLMCKVAGKSGIWIVLFLIPFVNIVVMVLLWAAISEKLNKPAWWGILMLVPIANFVIMGILAFSKEGRTVRTSKKASAISFSSEGGAVCSKCGVLAGSSDKFCPECGGKIVVKQEPKAEQGSGFCPECGAKITGKSKFCPGCGVKL